MLTFIGKAKKEIFYRFDIDIDTKTKKILLKQAKKEIVKDEEALLNYIIVKVLQEHMITEGDV